jgi:hypothetical protein
MMINDGLREGTEGRLLRHAREPAKWRRVARESTKGSRCFITGCRSLLLLTTGEVTGVEPAAPPLRTAGGSIIGEHGKGASPRLGVPGL